MVVYLHGSRQVTAVGFDGQDVILPDTSVYPAFVCYLRPLDHDYSVAKDATVMFSSKPGETMADGSIEPW